MTTVCRGTIPSESADAVNYRDRRRAESFGALAAQYDRTRPSYPPALFQHLSRGGAGIAVDVGCGTGRVASLLAGEGWRVFGLEPDERMAAIARARGIDVSISTFESWDAGAVRVDLVAAGTSWHWVDPDVGYDKAASVLRRDGMLAIFRNTYSYDRHVADTIAEVASHHAPHLLDDCVPLGRADPNRVELHRPDIAQRPRLFDEPQHVVFPHTRVVDSTEWIAELRTHSPIMMLGDDLAGRFLGELRSRVDVHARGRVHITHETHALITRRR